MISFDAYGQNATAELLKQGETITCACCESHYIAVGTTGGHVHILDLSTKVVTLLGPYDPITFVCALQEIVAIVTPRELIVFDREDNSETIQTPVAQIERVSISGRDGPKAGIICGRANEIVAVNKGWVRVSVQTLPIKVSGLKDLQVHFSLLCVIDGSGLKVYDLLTKESVYSFPMLICDQLLMHWISAEHLALAADDSLQLLEYSQQRGHRLAVLKSVTLQSVPRTIGQFN